MGFSRQESWSGLPFLSPVDHILSELSLGPRTDFPTWGSGKGIENPQRIWLWRPVGFDSRTSTGLGKQNFEGTKNLMCTRTQEKGAVTQQETEPDLPVSVQESPEEAWVDRPAAGSGVVITRLWRPAWVLLADRTSFWRRLPLPSVCQSRTTLCNPIDCM